jgi:putative flippase GtrA
VDFSNNAYIDKKMMTNQNVRQFIRFAAVGLTGTAVQYTCLGLGLYLYGDSAAVMGSAIGYVLGSIVNYVLNYIYTFGSTKSHAEAASKYFTILTIGWFLNLIMMSVMVNHWQWWVWMSQMISTGIGLCWNFGGSKLWAFKSKH